MLRRSLWVRLWTPIIIFLFGVTAGLLSVLVLWRPMRVNTEATFFIIRTWDGGYQFVRPLLTYEVKQADAPRRSKTLRDFISRQLEERTGARVGVYVEDLTDGSSFGYRADELFVPASLLKVPLAMGIMREVARDPRNDWQVYVYKNPLDENDDEYYRGTQVLKWQKVYQLPDVIYALIAASDNNARTVLVSAFGDAPVRNIFADLQLPYPDEDHTGMSFISPRTYGALLRALVGGSAVGHEQSDWLLKVMNQSEFTFGLRAGIPAEVAVSRKFGERTIAGVGDTVHKNELHECGVVYAPSRPFILCVMTEGTDMKQQADRIRRTAAFVYRLMIE